MTEEEFEEVKRECEKLGIEIDRHIWPRDQEFVEWCICRMVQKRKAGILHCLMPLNLVLK
jgi:hypothetical protein